MRPENASTGEYSSLSHTGCSSEEALSLTNPRPSSGSQKPISEGTIPGLVGLIDGLVIVSVGALYYFGYAGWNPDTYQIYAAAVAIDVALTVTAFHFANLYEFDTIVAWPRRLRRVVLVCGIVFLLLVMLAFALKISSAFSRVWFFASFLTAVALVIGLRGLLKVYIGRRARAGLLVRNVAIVGFGDQSRKLLGRLLDRDVPWKRVVGIFDDRLSRVAPEQLGVPVLGDLDELVSYVRKRAIDDVVIALPWNADERLIGIVGKLRELPVQVYLGADLIGYHFPRVRQSLFEGVPVLAIASTPLDGWGGIAKSLEDRIIATILVILLAPLMFFVALAVRLDSPGPVLFRQARYGFNNQVINVLKFRSMYDGRPPEAGVPQAQRSDPRVTRVGAFLRRTSLDELPQLFNVLEGTMSLVGPRPHAVEHNEKYAALIGGYFGRHKVRPGITGWVQVNGLRGETDTVEKMETRVEYDVYYIENWSLLFDLQILALTPLALIHENAY